MKSTTPRQDVRDSILDAAERLFRRYGYKKTTIDDLAREAGIGKGTVYLYFESKESVALSVLDLEFERIRERLQKIGRSRKQPVSRLRQILVERVMLRFASAAGYSQTLDEVFSSVRIPFLERRERFLMVEAQVCAEVLLEGRQQEIFEFEDAIETAKLLMRATGSLLPLTLTPYQMSRRQEIQETAGRIADLLIRGLMKRC
jgi:AcrR family transcriptional regulator